MSEPSHSQVVLIPSYNTGERVLQTVREALKHWAPVWVVVDGSDDGSGSKLDELARSEPHVRVLRFARNRGKGAVLLDGAREAVEAGFSHVLTMDADGQHSAKHIAMMLGKSEENPKAVILGKPMFDDSAPALRVHGRKVSNALAAIETLGGGIGDSLFGMRVYPAADLIDVMESTRFARRFDFEAEVAVRLAWEGVKMINVDVPVRYLSKADGGVSHFNYLRDNLLLSWMNLRLLFGSLWRLPRLVRGRRLQRALDDPDSDLSIERARLRVAGRFPSHWFKHYSRSKMATDPIFESVLSELRPLDGEILDLGCGQGVLAFYLKERGLKRKIRGVDHDVDRVHAADLLARRHYDGISFEAGDVCDRVSGFNGHVVITDVLQYLSAENQQFVYHAAARCVPPGGRLLIRTAIADGSARFLVQKIADFLARLVRWIPAKTRHYPDESELIEGIEREGLRLQGSLRKQWGRTPLNLYLAVFAREPIDNLRRPVVSESDSA